MKASLRYDGLLQVFITGTLEPFCKVSGPDFLKELECAVLSEFPKYEACLVNRIEES